MVTSTIRRAIVAACAVASLSCDSSRVTGVSTQPAQARGSAPSQPFLVSKPFACPTTEGFSTTAEIGPLGGLVSVGGASIAIPAGALLAPVTLTVTVPASNYVEIDVSVAGVEHFVFQQPVAVTVSYARCHRSDIDATPINAWYFDAQTRALLEQMPSVDNKLARSVTFTTGHLSGYILAN